uniref:Uncharacterized protein n=1 Tax=Oryza punctata TaxID=4537 RepID=A0A1Y8Z557_ORYPU
MQTLRRC